MRGVAIATPNHFLPGNCTIFLLARGPANDARGPANDARGRNCDPRTPGRTPLPYAPYAPMPPVKSVVPYLLQGGVDLKIYIYLFFIYMCPYVPPMPVNVQ